jgi:hypothetical protein
MTPPVPVTEHQTTLYFNVPLSDRDRAKLLKALHKENHMTVTPPAKAAPATRGVLTSEFWVTVAVAVGSVAAAAETSLPPRYAEIASAIAAVAYVLSRGQAKR